MRKLISKAKQQGFTLVELMIVVAIVGVLAVLAVYGVRKYIANAKTAEARNSIGQIAKDASVAYEKETTASAAVMAQGTSTATLRAMCSGASASVPSGISSVKGAKYQSSAAEWLADEATPQMGWACLKYTMDQPQYYEYTYGTSGSAASGDTFSAVANGDLNGDGNVSAFTLAGAIGTGMVLNISPTIAESNPEE